MKIQIVGSGPLAEQALRLAKAAGYEIVESGADYVLPATDSDDALRSLAGENAFTALLFTLAAMGAVQVMPVLPVAAPMRGRGAAKAILPRKARRAARTTLARKPRCRNALRRP